MITLNQELNKSIPSLNEAMEELKNKYTLEIISSNTQTKIKNELTRINTLYNTNYVAIFKKDTLFIDDYEK